MRLTAPIKILFISLVSSALLCQTAFAQISPPAGVAVGSGYLYPVLDTSIFNDDNLFNGESGTEINTIGYLISPNLTWDFTNNIQHFAFNWDLEAGFYDKSSREDYLDNTFNALFEFQPTDRFNGGVLAEYKDTHDPRGTGRAEGIITGLDQDPDEWHSFTIDGTWGYGAQSTPARVEGDLGYVSKEYDNNRSSTEFRDRDDLLAAGRFFYRIAPKTSLVAEGRYADADYKLDSTIAGSLNSTTYKVFGGITWESTAITTASIKLGQTFKDFDIESREDASTFTWEGNIQWAPMTYSVVNLSTARDFNETDGTGNFIQADSYSVDWTHDWNDRVRSVVDFSIANDTFDPTTREDDRVNGGINVSYQLQRWVTVSGSYRYEKRNSNRDAFDYDKSVFMFTATFNL
jgi:hypothetical protein